MFVEITGDRFMILPLGLVTFIAMTVANGWNVGLYHSLMDVQSLPFLPKHFPRSLNNLCVKDVVDTCHAVDVVRWEATREEVEDILYHKSEHNGFPVVNANGMQVGLAERVDLQRLLGEPLETNDGEEGPQPAEL